MVTVETYHGSNRQRLAESFRNSDIVLTTYETMRRDWMEKGPLYTGKWRRIVLDEAHHIRTRPSQTFKAACAIHARYRWCLTGTPIHNSLDDFASLLTFVGITPFQDKASFDYWVSTPIKEKHSDGLRRLRRLIKATCLRRTKKLIKTCQLPHRHERIEWVELAPEDRELYKFFEKKAANIASGFNKYQPGYSIDNCQADTNILSLINFLRLICDHGEELLPQSALQAWKSSNRHLIGARIVQAIRTKCDFCRGVVHDFGTQSVATLDCPNLHVICQPCRIKMIKTGFSTESSCPKCLNITTDDECASQTTPVATFPRLSPKVKSLIDNIGREQAPGRSKIDQPFKSVVFSCWTKMLDLVQQFLEAGGFICQRIDGQKSLEARSKAIDQFNSDSRCTILLASLGSGGEGIDLTAANNVHLLEPHWNPMVEAQAVDRVHRIGQSKEVQTTRYLTKNSIETYIQWIQRDKLKLIHQSLDSQQTSQLEIDNHRLKKLQHNLGVESAKEENNSL
ncbi:hypothetical protein QQS21_001233 [Conoideocrella luteorostrata]|uniref:Uncharacterized protein n=1 Tax=Conoideocrella luteorostrata TaxID=1105319 RepID=A0AAJ0G3J7_9HYPO|nr:hypothetical protein QQS21_001233 [Conoideocrella luteorostrata]